MVPSLILATSGVGQVGAEKRVFRGEHAPLGEFDNLEEVCGPGKYGIRSGCLKRLAGLLLIL
jgi:hypothetical protein